MHVHRQMDVAARLEASPQMREALRLASTGQHERACRVVNGFVEEAADPELKIFARRETIAWLGRMGRPADAAQLAHRLAEKAEELWGDDHRTLTLRNTEMYWAGKVGGGTRAEALADTLVSQAVRTLRPSDPLACAIRNNAARILEGSDQPGRAANLYRALLRDYARWGLSRSVGARATRHNYAVYLRKQEAFPEAIRTFQYQLLLVSGEDGPYSPEALATRQEIALVMFLADDVPGAIEQWDAVHSDARAHLGPNHPVAVESANYLLGCALALEDKEGTKRWSGVLLQTLRHSVNPKLRAALLQLRGSETGAPAE